MLGNLAVFTIVLAFLIAKLEIQIEGKDGWAQNLPTWRIETPLTRFFIGHYPLTGYHVWLFSTLFLLFHTPLWFGYSWNIEVELQVLAMFLFFTQLEDFFWFVFNPAYGLKKFSKLHIPWHKHWMWRFPHSYVRQGLIGVLLLILSFYV